MRKTFLKSERLSFSVWEKDDYELAKELWGNDEVAVWTKLPIKEDLESTCEHVGRQAIEYSAKHKSAINGTNGKVCLIFSFKNPQNARDIFTM